MSALDLQISFLKMYNILEGEKISALFVIPVRTVVVYEISNSY